MYDDPTLFLDKNAINVLKISNTKGTKISDLPWFSRLFFYYATCLEIISIILYNK